jgi:hypothetical protein
MSPHARRMQPLGYRMLPPMLPFEGTAENGQVRGA